MGQRYWIETLGCPKNEVDSAKLAGTLTADGYELADAPDAADLVVVNTCAFIEAARKESIDTVLTLDGIRRPDSRLVLTGCLAERYRHQLEEALPEVDLVAPFGTRLTPPESPDPNVADGHRHGSSPVLLGATRTKRRAADNAFDLLNLPRPPAAAPWAYVKVAEGCDRHCGFCAIPSFRGRQRSRSSASILDEVAALAAGDGLREVVLVAQDLASFGLDRWTGQHDAGRANRTVRPIVELVRAVSQRVDWVRLLYLFPSRLDDELVETILSTGVPYFDLSLQHVSRPLLARMRRPGEGERFLERIGTIRAAAPAAALRSSFIVGYPGETESDHDRLLQWLEAAQLDWVGFFPFSREEGTHAAGLDGQVPLELVTERLQECSEVQDAITAARRDRLIDEIVRVLVVAPGEGRTFREAPEIDGIVRVPSSLDVGSFADVVVTGAAGPDLEAELPSGTATRRPATAGPGLEHDRPTVAEWEVGTGAGR